MYPHVLLQHVRACVSVFYLSICLSVDRSIYLSISLSLSVSLSLSLSLSLYKYIYIYTYIYIYICMYKAYARSTCASGYIKVEISSIIARISWSLLVRVGQAVVQLRTATINCFVYFVREDTFGHRVAGLEFQHLLGMTRVRGLGCPMGARSILLPYHIPMDVQAEQASGSRCFSSPVLW